MLQAADLTIRLHPDDDVVIARLEIPAGTMLTKENVRAAVRVPAGHKIAVRAVDKGKPVHRYNQIIGFATQPIAPGDHVHVHNVAMGDFQRDYAFSSLAKPTDFVSEPATFMGIVRADGRVATRNYIGVISTVNCSAAVSKWVAEAFKGDALKALMREPRFMGARPLFVGDDLTDEHGFAAVASLGGAGILVGPARETEARYRLGSVAEAATWLRAAAG